MRIVDRNTFLALPTNTLYSKYKPCVFDDIAIKGDTWTSDFLSQSISGAIASPDSGHFVDTLLRAATSSESIPVDLNSWSRDGYFDDDQLFAVWEKDDVLQLIRRLIHLDGITPGDITFFLCADGTI